MTSLEVPSVQEVSPRAAGMRVYTRKRPEIIGGVQELCRLCLEKVDEVSCLIFAKENVVPSLPTRIMMCVGIEVIEEDYLPYMICKTCEKDLDHSYTFRKKCEMANRKLKCHRRAITIAKRGIQVNNQEVYVEKEINEQHIAKFSYEENCESQMVVAEESNHDFMADPSNTNNVFDHLNSNYEIKIVNNEYDNDNSNNQIVTKGEIIDDEDKIIINYEFVRNSNDEIVAHAEIEHAVREENENAGTLCIDYNEKANIAEDIAVKRAQDVVESSERPLEDSQQLLVDVAQSETFETQEQKHITKETEPSEATLKELRSFLLTKMSENNIIEMTEGVVTARDLATAGLQLATADGALLTLQFYEEHPEDAVLGDSFLTLDSDEKTAKGEYTNGPSHPRCNECGKSFSSRSVLKRHRLVHAAAAPHACPLCPRAFKQRAVLTRHLLVHSESRPHACPSCPRSFTQRGARDAHARSHAAPAARALQLHRCAACDKIFLYHSGLCRHMKTHTGKTYPCGACGRSFSDQSSLKRHARAHDNT